MAELSATFDRALEVLGGEALMSSAERQRGLKFPAGGERIAELLLQVAEQHGVTPPAQSKIDPEDIRARLRAAAELRPVLGRASVVEAAVSDRLRTNERAAWEPTLALYRLLQALAVSDAGIELSLAPIQELFASRKGKKTESSSPDAEEVTIDKTGLATTTIQRSTQRAPGAFEPAKSGLSSFVPASGAPPVEEAVSKHPGAPPVSEAVSKLGQTSLAPPVETGGSKIPVKRGLKPAARAGSAGAGGAAIGDARTGRPGRSPTRSRTNGRAADCRHQDKREPALAAGLLRRFTGILLPPASTGGAPGVLKQPLQPGVPQAF